MAARRTAPAPSRDADEIAVERKERATLYRASGRPDPRAYLFRVVRVGAAVRGRQSEATRRLRRDDVLVSQMALVRRRQSAAATITAAQLWNLAADAFGHAGVYVARYGGALGPGEPMLDRLAALSLLDLLEDPARADIPVAFDAETGTFRTSEEATRNQLARESRRAREAKAAREEREEPAASGEALDFDDFGGFGEDESAGASDAGFGAAGESRTARGRASGGKR